MKVNNEKNYWIHFQQIDNDSILVNIIYVTTCNINIIVYRLSKKI